MITFDTKIPSELSVSELEKRISSIPSLFHRRWIRASIRGYLWKMRVAQKHRAQGNIDSAEKEERIAVLWFGQAKRLVEVVTFFKNVSKVEIDARLMKPEELILGDIILSYKMKRFLRRAPLSWCIKFASNSPVTHALIASHQNGAEPELLVSGDTTSGLGVVHPIPKRGEIFIVMRAQPEVQRAIKEQIQLWRERAQEHITNDRKYFSPYRFPELKVQIASVLGLLIVPLTYLGIPFSFPNPLRNMPGVFCSELIDVIFKHAGVLLTPRSEHDAAIGPIEFLYSPLLELKGFVAQEGDLTLVHKEIQKQFHS